METNREIKDAEINALANKFTSKATTPEFKPKYDYDTILLMANLIKRIEKLETDYQVLGDIVDFASGRLIKREDWLTLGVRMRKEQYSDGDITNEEANIVVEEVVAERRRVFNAEADGLKRKFERLLNEIKDGNK